MGPVLLALGLVAYNNVANRWAPFNRGAYVPCNLVATGVVLAIGLGAFGLEPAGAGLAWSGAWIGLAIGAAAVVVLAAMLSFERGRALLRDRRLEDVRGGGAVYMVAVRIPFGTAVLEEVAFRGVLLGALLPEGRAAAVTVSSVAFGLWHVAPTLNLARANRLGHQARIAAGGVIVTGAAGAGLALLRVETGAIAAPLLAHALVNALAASASVLAHRRAEPG